MSNRTQIFINDQEIDLSSDSPIALSFQIADLGNPANQKGNTSNQFQIPDTQNNRKILGFPNNVNYNNPDLAVQLCYTKFRARVIQNSIEVLPNAVMELSDPAFDNDQFNVTILSGNVDFFDLIGGQLADMGDSTSQWSNYGANLVWKPYDHLWNLQNAANSQKNTATTGNNGLGGWIYPVVDYGFFTSDYSQRINVKYMRPGFFIKTAIDLMLKFTGYKAKGSLLKNPLYPKLIAQFSNSTWDHGVDYQNLTDDNALKASQQRQITYDHPNNDNAFGIIYFDTVTSDPGNHFVQNYAYVTNQINDIIITVNIPRVYLQGYVTPVEDSTKFVININYNDPVNTSDNPVVLNSWIFGFDGHGEDRGPGDPESDPNGWRRLSGSGSNIRAEIDLVNATLSFQTQLPPQGAIYISYQWLGKNPCYATIFSGATLTVASQKQSVLFGQMVQCERIFPEVGQKDLIKDTLQRFGIICQTDSYNKTITFASLGDIVNNIPLAKDWSSKLLNQGRQVSLKLGDYSQVNYLEYQPDPNAGNTPILPKYGWSQINVKNQTLPILAKDLLVSIFGASLNRDYIGGSVAYIQMADPVNEIFDFSISVAPRILIDEKLNLTALNKSVTFTDDEASDPNDPDHNITINDVISVPYFWKEGVSREMSLLWNDLRLLYYPALEKVLNNCKVQTEYFLLTPRDMAELDFLYPIYLEKYSSFYYINTIDNWIENKPVRVTLVKLG